MAMYMESDKRREVGSEDFNTSDSDADLSLSNEEDVEPRTVQTVQTKEHAATLQLRQRLFLGHKKVIFLLHDWESDDQGTEWYQEWTINFIYDGPRG
ncbi:UNVERIFIED_CONTAM: hypothetical protein FKN15_006189 [Acipenser sinensis]